MHEQRFLHDDEANLAQDMIFEGFDDFFRLFFGPASDSSPVSEGEPSVASGFVPRRRTRRGIRGTPDAERVRKTSHCPPSVLEMADRLHVSREWAEDVFYANAAQQFNRQTITQAFALTVIAGRERPITLRGCFYRAVSAGVYPNTDERHYRQCGNILLKLRRIGRVDYEWIVDSTRRRLKPSSWSGLADYLDSVAACYRRDLWARQTDYIEFFVEKDAMAAVIEPVTEEYDVHLTVIRGMSSESMVWQVAQAWKPIDKPIYAYYLGDHDPAGLRIEEDLRKRISDLYGGFCTWNRVAIGPEDFYRDDLLGFPIKGNRSQQAWQTLHADYLERYGDRCVEVDAIPPQEIRDRLREIIEGHIDQDEWEHLKAHEYLEKETTRNFALAQRKLIKEEDEVR